jgi:hypothetical protein
MLKNGAYKWVWALHLHTAYLKLLPDTLEVCIQGHAQLIQFGLVNVYIRGQALSPLPQLLSGWQGQCPPVCFTAWLLKTRRLFYLLCSLNLCQQVLLVISKVLHYQECL